MSGIHVAVSGITGYVGAQVTHDLLKRGYNVHGTCRRNTPGKIAHLTAETYPGRLQVFEADLLTQHSFDEAVKDCQYAIHIASPFVTAPNDPQKDLVDPALKGTLGFLESCHKAGIEKVILTSSLAAIADHGVKGKVFSEKDWNTHSSLKFLPYYYSKTLAERAAWDFAEKHPEMKLVVINPVIVFGPSMVKSLNESHNVPLMIASGEVSGVLDLDFAVVDVRDVSEAHIRAMESRTASGRYICCADTMVHNRDIVRIANEMGFNTSTTELTNPIMTNILKVVSFFSPGGNRGQYVRSHIGKPIVPTNAKIKKELNMSFRDSFESTKETIQTLIEWGHLSAPASQTE